MKRTQEPLTFKPIGLALAAVVAGAAPAVAAEAPAQVRLHTANAAATAEPEDETLILGPSAPVEPFSAPASAVRSPVQGSLFDL